jgi:hypothetical protein
MRSVRIDEKERPAISIEVAGQTFVIRRVVTGVRQRWGEFMQLQGQALQMVDDLKQKIDKAGGTETEALKKEIDSMNGLAEKIAKARESAEEDCLQLILEKNGYEFNRNWWIDETDSVDRQSCIIEAINKDSVGAIGKKKAVS